MTTRQTLMSFTLITSVMTAGCGPKAAPPSGHDTPTLSLTHWTDKTELFMEHPPLVGGHTALFAVHLTAMNDFKALNDAKGHLSGDRVLREVADIMRRSIRSREICTSCAAHRIFPAGASTYRIAKSPAGPRPSTHRSAG